MTVKVDHKFELAVVSVFVGYEVSGFKILAQGSGQRAQGKNLTLNIKN
jgi:hypothetical protein